MSFLNHGAAALLGFTLFAGLTPAQDWTEAAVVQQFLEQSPHAREARARTAIAEADARGRTLYANPRLRYVREGAGLTEFLQAEQQIHLSGRLRFLRDAGASSVLAAQADGAFDLWQARSDLRLAFFHVLAGQERELRYAAALREIEDVIAILATREREGEGSTFDRLRAERERAELRAELELLRATIELDRARLLAFLPPATSIPRVAGRLDPTLPPSLEPATLAGRAFTLRADYRAEQQRLHLFRFEQRAAERLRIPEPTVSAGYKRADIGQGLIAHGGVVEFTVPLPLFNKGQAEVSRFTAEQQRTQARLDLLAQQIHAEIAGALRALQVRAAARDRYRLELAASGEQLVRIATIAYQEGDIGILQLLDAYRTQRESQLRLIDIQLAVKQAQIELERVLGEEFPQ
jgi:cobalt-zinc-cadmium efflux system outer membrane protein